MSGGLSTSVFLIFPVLLFVGQVLIDVAAALDVGLLFQQVEAAEFLALGGRSSPKRSSISTLRLRSVALNSLTYLTRNSA